MKKMILIILILLMVFSMAGCKTRTVHCDHCGKEITVKEKSNVTEEWILYCNDCNEELFDGDPLLDPTP